MSKQPASIENLCGLSDLIPVEFFKALSDPTRVAMLAGLAAGACDKSVSEIASACPVDLSVVSRHLKILERAGLVESERRAREARYRVRIPHAVALLRRLADALERCCPEPCDAAGETGDAR